MPTLEDIKATNGQPHLAWGRLVDVAVSDYDISPGILLPLLGAILALLGLEASALWRGVK